MDPLLFRLITGCIAGLGCFILGALAYFKGRQNPINQIFTFSNLSLGLWNIADVVIMLMRSHPQAILVDRLSYFAGVPVIHCFFLLCVTTAEAKLTSFFMRALKILTGLMAVIILTPWVLKDVIVTTRIEEVPGPLYPLFVVYFVGTLGYGLFLLFKGYKNSVGHKKTKLGYMLFSLFFAFVAGVSYFLSMVDPTIIPIYYILELVYLLILTYAILQYKLMDINLAFRYGTIGFFVSMILGAPFGVAIWLLTKSFFAATLGLVGPLISHLSAARLRSLVTSFVDKLPPFRGRYRSLADVPGLQKAISTSANVKQWAQNTGDSINRLLEVENVVVFVYDESQQIYLATDVQGVDFGQMYYSSPRATHPLISHLKSSRKILQRDYVDMEVPASARRDVVGAMDLIQASLCVPFFTGGQMIGFISIGRKLKREVPRFEPRHFNLPALCDVLQEPLVVTENFSYINTFLQDELGIKQGRDPHTLSAHEMADGFNRVAGRAELAKGLPFPDAMGLKSEGLALFNRLRLSGEKNGADLTPLETSSLNRAILAANYWAELVNVREEAAFNDEDLKLVWGLAQGAEAALMVILVTLAGQIKTAEWAHDLRHPFTKGSFRMIADLLAGRQGPLTQKQVHTLSLIQADAHFVQRHIADIVSPETAGKMKLNRTSVQSLLRAVEARYSYVAELSGVLLRLVLPEGDAAVQCDEELIHYRVFNNLMDNALRYTPKGGWIEVGFLPNASKVHCFVKNVGGPPINAEMIPHLFERGTNFKKAERSGRGLAGLGLYNVASVVEAHRGKVEVRSSVSEGTVFEFTLPMA